MSTFIKNCISKSIISPGLGDLILLISTISGVLTDPGSKYTRKLLVVSMDGFRWDYTRFTDTPNLDLMVEYGTSVEYMQGVFPSKTFPSHISIATGVHPETHGIVGNYMYDPITNRTFTPWNHNHPDWWKSAEPVWITAKKQGLRTGVYFWIGSSIPIQGILPDYTMDYSSSIDFRQRVDTVVSWFKRDNVDLAMLYLHEPDATAHNTGTPLISIATIDVIAHCDATLGYLLAELEAANLHNINILVLSDHGMTDLDVDRIISLTDYISMEDIQTVADEGPLANILPKPGRVQAVYEGLKGRHPHMQVYKREEVPERLHFRNNARIHPVIAIADEGWVIVENVTVWQGYNIRGSHGYDNALTSMRAFFRALGPNIRRGYTSPVFRQIDVYSLMCELLEIKPAPNNGSLDVIGQMLHSRTQHHHEKINSSAYRRHYGVILQGLTCLIVTLYVYFLL